MKSHITEVLTPHICTHPHSAIHAQTRVHTTYIYISFVLSIYDSKKDHEEIFFYWKILFCSVFSRCRKKKGSHINKYSFFLTFPSFSLCDCSCPKLFQMPFCTSNSPTFFYTAKKKSFRGEIKVFFPVSFSSY